MRIVRINNSPTDIGHDMIVCICHGINDKAIYQAVAEGACTMSDLACHVGVGTCCGKCRDCAQLVLDDALGATYAKAA